MIILADLFGNGYSHGCLFQMINGLFVYGTQLYPIVLPNIPNNYIK